MTAPTADNVPRLLLTVEEAAKRLGICRSNMFKLIRNGDVESVRIGRLRRITPAHWMITLIACILDRNRAA